MPQEGLRVTNQQLLPETTNLRKNTSTKPCGITPGDYSKYEAMVRDEFGVDAPIMLEIARAESRFDPTAKNCSSSATGIFQILKGTWEGAACAGERTDAISNIKCARKLYTVSGVKPWESSREMW